MVDTLEVKVQTSELGVESDRVDFVDVIHL